jgi:hypothetical protein
MLFCFEGQLKYGWTPIQSFSHSGGPYIPTLALLCLSGGVAGFIQIVLIFGFLFWSIAQSPNTEEEYERFKSCLLGCVIQTLLGYSWIVYETDSIKMLQTALTTAITSNDTKTSK